MRITESEGGNPMDALYRLYEMNSSERDEVDSTWVDTDYLPKGVLARFTYTKYGNGSSDTKITLSSQHYRDRRGTLKEVLMGELGKTKEFDDLYGKANILEVLGHEAYHKMAHEKGTHDEYEEGRALIAGKIFKYLPLYNNDVSKAVDSAVDEVLTIKNQYDSLGADGNFYSNYLVPASRVIEDSSV